MHRVTRVSLVAFVAHPIYEDKGYISQFIGRCHRHSLAKDSLHIDYVSLHCKQERSDYDRFHYSFFATNLILAESPSLVTSRYKTAAKDEAMLKCSM